MPSGIRRLIGPAERVSITGMIPEPMLAPNTKAKARSSGTTPLVAKDMTRSTTATLEWAIQVSTAASNTARIGSSASGRTTLCRTSLPLSGADAPTIKVSDRRRSPTPIRMRPICCTLDAELAMKQMTPTRINAGEAQAISKERT